MHIIHIVPLLTLVSWIIFGFITGFITHMIDPADVRGGLIGTTVFGIIGALIGGFLAAIFFGVTNIGFSIESLAISVIGALIFAFLQRALFRDNKDMKSITVE